MRILDARDNEPLDRRELLVDQVPTLDTLRFTKVPTWSTDNGHGHLYVAEHDGYVQFFYQAEHERGRGKGFYGRVFHIRLADGTSETLVGLWSSNPEAVNLYVPGLEPRMVVLTDDPRDFSEDRHFTREGHITARLWEQISTQLARQGALRTGPAAHSASENQVDDSVGVDPDELARQEPPSAPEQAPQSQVDDLRQRLDAIVVPRANDPEVPGL